MPKIGASAGVDPSSNRVALLQRYGWNISFVFCLFYQSDFHRQSNSRLPNAIHVFDPAGLPVLQVMQPLLDALQPAGEHLVPLGLEPAVLETQRYIPEVNVREFPCVGVELEGIPILVLDVGAHAGEVGEGEDRDQAALVCENLG